MVPPTRLALRLLLCLAFGLAGAGAAVSAVGPTSGETALGTASVDARPALGRGRIDVYVPIVDWGVRSRPYGAPVGLDLEVRALDRGSIMGALRSAADADRELGRVRTDVGTIVRRELRRSLVIALAGGALGGLFAGALLAAFGRRRWLVTGTACGLAAAAVVTGVSAATISGLGEDAFREPVFYARGGELPKLLAFSEQLGQTTERYTDSYEQALAGLEQLIALIQQPPKAVALSRSALVVSDLHSNSLVLPALAEFASGKTVFFVGDFAQLGTEHEQWIVPPVSRLGARVVAVSGNHDSGPLMRSLAAAGATVLTRNGRLLPDGTTDGRPLARIDGLLVAGYDDPLEGDGQLSGHHLLEAKGETLQLLENQFVLWFRSLPERPDVVLVHQHGLAHALLRELAPDETPLLILTGHDHKAHVERRGPHVLVDGGTAGAGGPLAIGQQPAGFAQIHFRSTSTLAAVDLVEIEPISGAGSARRIPIAPPIEPTSEDTISLDAAAAPQPPAKGRDSEPASHAPRARPGTPTGHDGSPPDQVPLTASSTSTTSITPASAG